MVLVPVAVRPRDGASVNDVCPESSFCPPSCPRPSPGPRAKHKGRRGPEEFREVLAPGGGARAGTGAAVCGEAFVPRSRGNHKNQQGPGASKAGQSKNQQELGGGKDFPWSDFANFCEGRSFSAEAKGLPRTSFDALPVPLLSACNSSLEER